ncbi:MAG: hypothetical protein LBT38_03355 [Deltaproteobacteria bacterium]|nr:hypothetical protein [Deltaproteobacteria bacterium]
MILKILPAPKGFALALFLTLTLAFPWPLKAEEKAKPALPEPTTLARLNQEGPLTQEDIDLFVKFSALFSSWQKKDRKSANNPKADWENEILNFIKANNISKIRLRYILEKIPDAARNIIAQASPKPYDPDYERPYIIASDLEKELIQENLLKIQPFLKALAD